METDSLGQEQDPTPAGSSHWDPGRENRAQMGCSSRGGEEQVGPRFILKVELPGFADGSDITNETKRRAMMISKVWTE